MGFYVYIARPKGSGPIDQDAIHKVLNAHDDLEHVKVNDWWSSGGTMALVREDVDGDFDGPFISCRFSWASRPQTVADTLHTYIGLAEELGMIVTLGKEKITRDRVSEIAGKYFKAAETVKDVLGTAEPVRRRELGPPLVERDFKKHQEILEKIRARDFEYLNIIAHLLCRQCGVTFEVTDKWGRGKEDEFGIKVESDNQYYQIEACPLCYGDWHGDYSVEELPLH